MENQNAECHQSECAHYIGKDKIGLYKGKFLWSIIIATVMVVVIFIAITKKYNSSLNEIINIHKSNCETLITFLEPAVISPDSCIYVNEQLALSMQEHMQNTEALLLLQSQKIQSDFTILSIWAGILMIVFLVFSIYSMYKTDELIKQGKEGLNKIEDAHEKAIDYIEKIDSHVNDEMDKVTKAASSQVDTITTNSSLSIDEIKKQAEEEKQSFGKMLSEKTEQFQKIYNDYVSKLDEATKANQNSINTLLTYLRSSESMKKDDSLMKKEGGEK